jgi:hypothetical protein
LLGIRRFTQDKELQSDKELINEPKANW